MRSYKAILHDWDDTIVQSFNTYSSWYREFAETYDLEVPSDDLIKSQWGQTVLGIIVGTWPHLSEAEATDLFEKFEPKKDYTVPPFEKAKETLEKLSEDHILGVVSSGNKASIHRSYKLFIHPEFDYHDFVHTQEYCDHHKPDPRVFDPAFKELDKYSIDESDVVYIGDHLLDHLAAKNRGIDFIATTTGIHDKNDFLEAGLEEDNILPSFSHLLDHLS